MDFTLKTYKNLLSSLLRQGFSFQTFTEFLHHPASRVIILRHDVDDKKFNSLHFAQIQHELGIRGVYYFRAVPESWDEKVIKEVHRLGHEVGYHYESLTTCNGNMEDAYRDFTANLQRLRSLVPVTTICMHGSPRSPHDSKDLWKHYNYRSLGIIGEPYFDIDFNKFFYLTDTGRRWDGWRISVRDKVPQQEEWIKQGLVFRTTSDIIKALSNRTLSHIKMRLMSELEMRSMSELEMRSMSELEMRSMSEVELPDQIMMTFHPQRWSDKPLPWIKELLWQGVKNVVKRALIQIKKG